MSVFRERLRTSSTARAPRGWVFVPYDQLTHEVGPLSRTAPGELGIVVVEAPAKAGRRGYHKQKLALVLANLRHSCLEQAARGVPVVHLVSDDPDAPYARALARFLDDKGLDPFDRALRRRTGILMEAGEPVGGRFSFDEENRKPWKGTPPAPEPPRFTPDDVTEQILELVRTRFADHPGTLDAATLPATRDDADALWSWALSSCLPSFGPFEDAMSTRSRGLFHTRISALLNIHRLLPRDVVKDALASEIPLASKEGFVRQILGWREFVRHIHVVTNGLRKVRSTSVLDAHDPVPPAYWPGAKSGLHCLDTVVDDVWAEGWSHHIALPLASARQRSDDDKARDARVSDLVRQTLRAGKSLVDVSELSPRLSR
jgi:deoxyribodipyrimidine photolyase-related protein